MSTAASVHMEPQTVFRSRGLTKIYRIGEVEVHALRSIDLDLYDGELVVLLGPSGSGKSTLLNILGGLDAPTSGEVVFRDHVLTGANDRQLTRFRREHVGFVFQFYNLIPSLTAVRAHSPLQLGRRFLRVVTARPAARNSAASRSRASAIAARAGSRSTGIGSAG